MMEINIGKYNRSAELTYAKHVLWLPLIGSVFATFVLFGMFLSYCKDPYCARIFSISFIPALLLGRNMLLVDQRIRANKLAKYLAYFTLGIGILGFAHIIEVFFMIVMQVLIFFHYIS